MRILHAIQELEAGGAERVVIALASAARNQGHDVAVAAAPGVLDDDVDATRFPLPLVQRRLSRLPGGVLALRRAIRAFAPEIVHCHNPGIAALTGAATIRGRRPHALVTVHGVPDEDYGRAARVLRLAGLPVVACGPGVEAALADHRVRAETVVVNGIPPAPEPADRAALAAEWGLDSEQPLIVAVGRLVPVKNHLLAVRAITRVPEAALVLVGQGPLADDLARAAAAAGVADRVVLAGLRRDARAIIGAADAVVLPSHSEGLPLVGLEALAAGTPLVATDVRGVRELVGDAAALLVPPDDPAALAAALSRVLSDAELPGRLVRAGREVAARYTEEEMVARYLELYQRLGSRG